MRFLSGEVSGNRPKICASEKIVVSYNWHGITLFHGPLNVHFMTEIRIGYARCSTDRQDLTARQEAPVKPGVSPERIYTDKGLTGMNRLILPA